MNTIFPIILIAGAIGLFALYTDPTYNAALAQKTQAAAYTAALGDSKELVNTRQNLLTKYNSISSDNQQRLTEMLPDSVDNIRLILEVANIAARYGMVPKDVSFSGDSGSPSSTTDTGTTPVLTGSAPLGTISMDFTVSGSYQSFEQFLTDLSSSLRLIDVTGIQFGVGAHDFSDYKVTVTAYWLTPSTPSS